MTAVLPASGKNGDDTGWVRFKLPIASDPGQIQGAVDTTTGLHVIGTNTDEFIGWLEHLSHREIPGKEANQLISPAIFDPDRDPYHSRGLGNIVHVHHLWLDFENGDLRPEELPRLFPNIRMVVTNSYRHHANAPRFRVFIPVRQPLTPAAYELLWDLIAEKIEHAGYEVPKPGKQKQTTSNFLKSGLDRGKRTPSSLFYLPCQAEDPSKSFFTDYKDDGRAILDSEVWFGNSVIPFQQPPPEAHARTTESHGEPNQTLVDSATEEWRESRHHEGEGNHRFWAYALKLRTAGMNTPQIEAKLWEEAQFARHPDQRRAQIPSIMTSLRQSRQKAG